MTPYYSMSAVYRQERKCVMRSKTLAVQFGILVLLMSLSTAVASDLGKTPLGMTGSIVGSSIHRWFIPRPRVATPEPSWKITWRGRGILNFSCKNLGVTIRYTYAPEGKVAPYPTSSSPIFPRCGLYLTKPCMVRARSFIGNGGRWLSSSACTVIIRR